MPARKGVKKTTKATRFDPSDAIRRAHVLSSSESLNSLRQASLKQAELMKSLLKKNVEAGVVPADEELQRAARIDELAAKKMVQLG